MSTSVYLLPAADIGSVGGIWSKAGAPAGYYDALDEVPAGTPDDEVSIITGLVGAVGDTTDRWMFTMQALPAVVVIEKVRFHTYRRQIAGDCYDRLCVRPNGAGTTYYSGNLAPLSAAFGWSYKDWLVDPSTGSPWTRATINTSHWGIVVLDDTAAATQMRWSQIYLEVFCTLEPAYLAQARDVLSRGLRYRSRSPVMVGVTVPEWVGLDLVLGGDPASLSHYAGTHPSDAGWLEDAWRRRLISIESLAASGSAGTVQIRALDLRPLLVLYRDTAWATLTSSGMAEGVSIIDAGCARTFTRASAAWIEGPDGLIYRAEVDVEAHAANGDLYEGARTNEILYSSSNAGTGTTFTGWGPCTGGTVAEQTTDLPWDLTEVGRAPRITMDNPITGNLRWPSSVTASQPANTIGVLSVDHYDWTAAAPCYWICQRAVDSWCYSAATDSWGAAVAWNPIPLSLLAWTRWESAPFSVGANATTIYFEFGAKSTDGVAGQSHTISHAQWEVGVFATSRIKTGAARVTRAASRLLTTNDTGARCWPARRCGFSCEVAPEWNAADVDVAATIKTILYLSYDANNTIKIGYDGDNQRFFADFKAAGATVTAYKAAAPVAGTFYKIQVRVIGSDGELDLAPYTVQIFVDDVKGTDAVGAALPTEAADCDLERGSAAAADHFDGQIRMFTVLQYVPTDEELVRL